MAPTLSFLAIAALFTSVFAFPSPASSPESSGGLARRNNYYNLKCGNAPDYVGGTPLPADQGVALPNSYPTTGSSKEAFQYMYCTPGTSTYVFFWLPDMSPPPLPTLGIAQAFNMTSDSFSNQEDLTVPEGSFTVNPVGTNVEIHMENANKGELTWGIVRSALSGLAEWNTHYNNGCNGGACNPIVFEVNDGQWGEIAIGYAGYYDAADKKCILQIKGGNHAKYTYCSDLGKMTS